MNSIWWTRAQAKKVLRFLANKGRTASVQSSAKEVLDKEAEFSAEDLIENAQRLTKEHRES